MKVVVVKHENMEIIKGTFTALKLAVVGPKTGVDISKSGVEAPY
jgi:hypothetical protein